MHRIKDSNSEGPVQVLEEFRERLRSIGKFTILRDMHLFYSEGVFVQAVCGPEACWDAPWRA